MDLSSRITLATIVFFLPKITNRLRYFRKVAHKQVLPPGNTTLPKHQLQSRPEHAQPRDWRQYGPVPPHHTKSPTI